MSDFVCRDCGELLTEENRTKKSMSAKGKQYYLNRCKPCIVDAEVVLRKLKRENPMPPAGTPCNACGRLERLYCDHDHATKKFRGWICRQCNAGMGLLGDSEAGLRRALQYLERSRSWSPKSVPKFKKDDKTDHTAGPVDMAPCRADDEQQGSEVMPVNS